MALSAEAKFCLEATTKFVIAVKGIESVAKNSPKEYIEEIAKVVAADKAAGKDPNRLSLNVLENRQEAEQLVAGLLGMM